MHPAFSVIFFTVTSGLGYGLLVMTAIMGFFIDPFNQPIIQQDIWRELLMASSGIGIALATLGLISSTLHLANVKNAWRAMFRFKSSWLSREGVFAILSFPIVFAYMAVVYWTDMSGLFSALTIMIILISLTTVFSTGMIYACLKTIRAWNTSLVPVNYILLSLLGGIFALNIIFAFYGASSTLLFEIMFVLLFLAFLMKVIYYFWIGQPSNLTVKSATGLAGPTRLLDNGESSKNFLSKEFGYDISARIVLIIRSLSILFIFIIPVILLLGELSFNTFVMILVIHYIGLFCERWLFFAEAKHVVNLFYGREV
ncbi:Anaerobic dimethyl sulfoxide reductase chain C [hydrothermal vent metagenome]|uniref:Anaerobic dimethyl sulfoxide reductase chain C n=1 Tax=hydrothermal vent metagenome TaxID=652676 RepID=A0A1W1BHC7_9ZZZZ